MCTDCKIAKRCFRGSPNNFHQSRTFFFGLLQLRVFGLSRDEDGDVGVGVFP
jgi:hypothetical protein